MLSEVSLWLLAMLLFPFVVLWDMLLFGFGRLGLCEGDGGTSAEGMIVAWGVRRESAGSPWVVCMPCGVCALGNVPSILMLGLLSKLLLGLLALWSRGLVALSSSKLVALVSSRLIGLCLLGLFML